MTEDQDRYLKRAAELFQERGIAVCVSAPEDEYFKFSVTSPAPEEDVPFEILATVYPAFRRLGKAVFKSVRLVEDLAPALILSGSPEPEAVRQMTVAGTVDPANLFFKPSYSRVDYGNGDAEVRCFMRCLVRPTGEWFEMEVPDEKDIIPGLFTLFMRGFPADNLKRSIFDGSRVLAHGHYCLPVASSYEDHVAYSRFLVESRSGKKS